MNNNELKIIDLCGRLPYGVFCLVPDHDNKMIRVSSVEVNTGAVLHGDIYPAYYDDWLAYLRPLSSMTDEERNDPIWHDKWGSSGYADQAAIVDWLNAHHFDYRGLIEQGLALKAPEDMYKPKNQ